MPCYYPQTGKLAIGKEFYAFIDKVALNDNFFVGGDFNGHVGCDVGSFGKVLRVFVIGQVNDWEITLMDWTVGKALPLMNSCFKIGKSQLQKSQKVNSNWMILIQWLTTFLAKIVKEVKLRTLKWLQGKK